MAPLVSRLLLLGINYSPEHTGIAPYTSGIAAGLAREGNAVRALTSHPHYPAWQIAPGYGQWSKREHLNGVRVRRLLHYVPRRPNDVARLLSEVTFGLRLAFSRWGHPTVIVAVSPALFSSAITFLRARLTHRRVPFVLWVQDLYAQGLAELGSAPGLASRLVKHVEAFVIRNADAVVVIHERFADKVVTDFRVPRERVHVVRNWTHIATSAHLTRSEARVSLGWPDDVRVVLHAGNMGAKQGLENVIEAARLIDDQRDAFRFVLLGDGAERARLEELADGVDSVQFMRPLSSEDFPTALMAADVLLVNERPGVAEMALPSKLTSYFAAARPVVAATHPEGMTAAEIRAARAGEVVAAGEPTALVEVIRKILRDPVRAAELGANGQRYQSTVLTEAHAVESFHQLLNELERTSRRRRRA